MKAMVAFAVGIFCFVAGVWVFGVAAIAGAWVLWVKRREELLRERHRRRKMPLVMRMLATMGGDA